MAGAEESLRGGASGGPDAVGKGARLLYVDNLRVALTVLVVLHHAALSFMGTDPVASGVLTMFVVVNQAYFMGLFFLIAGYFVPGSVARKGGVAFLRDRLMRLLLPLVGYVVVLSPVTALDANSGADLGGPWWRLYLENLSVGALWFLEVLLAFTVAYAVLAMVAGERIRRVLPASPDPQPLLSAVEAVLWIVGVALLTYLLRTVLPVGAQLLNLPTPSHLPQYVAMFLLGAVAYRYDWFNQISARAGRAGFVGAAAATVILLPLALMHMPTALGASWHWSSFAYAVWESTLCVGLSVGLLSLFRRRFDRQGRVAAFLSAHAFTVFLLHLPVIACLTQIVGEFPGVPFLGFVINGSLAVAISFAAAYPLRSLTPLRRVL